MIITLTGRPCTGKSTISKIMNEKYGFKVIDMGLLFNEEAARRGLSKEQFSELRVKDPSVDFEFDKNIPLSAKKFANENLIFDSRVAHHFLPDAFKVYLTLDADEMANRLINSDRTGKEKYSTKSEALATLQNRMKTERIRYKNIYGFDLEDMTNYDLVLTSIGTPEELAKKMYDACVEYYQNKRK